MKKILAVMVVFLLSAGISFAEKGHKGHDGSMGKLVFKGDSKGIKVKGYLNDMESAMKAIEKSSGMKMDMSKMDPNLTHHISFMIDGKVKSASLKITGKGDAKEYSLMSMSGHYGSDISLKARGKYQVTLEVETENSGKVTFSFDLKN